MNKPRIAVVGIPGKWSTEILADRLEEQTGFRAVIDMADVVADLTTGEVKAGDIVLNDLDGIVVKKISEIYAPAAEDRIHLLGYLESYGVKIFSPPKSIDELINRLSGTLALRKNDIPMPKTKITESIEEAIKAVRDFGEVVLKPLYSTKARGMIVLTSEMSDSELETELTRYQANNQLFYIQKKANLSGRDLGMVFIGGEYSCTYARVGSGDSWNTTILAGGKYESYEPTPELIELGRKAQACYDLSFTTVDIALTDEGPIVFEVSAFGGFKGALEGCGIDAAGDYANYILKSLEV